MSVMSRPDQASRPPVGGAPVTDLHTMGGEEALAVVMLRDWFDGIEGQGRVTGTFLDGLGPTIGPAAVSAWREYADFVTHGTRRPVMRHAVTCRCVGSDEAVLAQTLTQAACGAREDAMLVLSRLVPAERLLPALQVFERAGRAVLRVAARLRLEAASCPPLRPLN